MQGLHQDKILDSRLECFECKCGMRGDRVHTITRYVYYIKDVYTDADHLQSSNATPGFVTNNFVCPPVCDGYWPLVNDPCMCMSNTAHPCQKASSAGKQMRALSPMVEFWGGSGAMPHMPSSAATGCAVTLLQNVATPA